MNESPSESPLQDPDHPGRPGAADDGPVGREPGAEPGTDAPHRRTHPITPLVTGWKIVVGIIAVLMAQNIARLLEDFTVTRALIGLGVIAVGIVIAMGLSTLAWWFTTYAVDDAGVALHKGLISRSREYAPRARIESVSVERPLLARLLGLAKVRVEVAGGGESYLDIEYVKNAEADALRRRILQVAAGPARPAAAPEAPAADGDPADPAAGTAPAPEGAGSGALEQVLYDGVTDGELIAKIPTARLLHSLVRDIGFLIGIVMSFVGVALAIVLGILQEGASIAVLVALLPTLIAVPRYVFGRIDSGWGFVSRITDRGLRMRRGLANTRTDNIASGRVQRFELRRPLLWRGPDWTAVTVTVAGIEESSENGAQNALPVGTREELRSTLGHLAAPLGTEDDLATIRHLMTARARDIEGLRTPIRPYWISRRTRVSVLLPGALIHRSGILTRRIEIIPRERIQALSVQDGPLGRRIGVLDLKIGVAGHTMTVSAGARQDVLALHERLSRDAATLRRYRDREHWPRPALAGTGAPGQEQQ